VKPQQTKRAYNDLIVQRDRGTPLQNLKHSTTSNSNNQSRKPSHARSQADDDKILSEDLAAMQAYYQNQHDETLKLAKLAQNTEAVKK
jgi:hypothetical protein